MSKVIDWIARHGWTLLIGAVSFLAGMAVMLPMGWTLDGAAAGLIGAIVGAVATIGGAVLLWQVQDRHRSEQIAKAMALQLGSIFGLCDDLLESASGHDPRKIERDVVSFLEEIDLCKKKLARFDQSLHLLSSGKVASLLSAEILMDTTKSNAERVRQIVPYISGHPTLANQTLDDAGKSLRENYSQLGEELEIFAPGWAKED